MTFVVTTIRSRRGCRPGGNSRWSPTSESCHLPHYRPRFRSRSRFKSSRSLRSNCGASSFRIRFLLASQSTQLRILGADSRVLVDPVSFSRQLMLNRRFSCSLITNSNGGPFVPGPAFLDLSVRALRSAPSVLVDGAFGLSWSGISRCFFIPRSALSTASRTAAAWGLIRIQFASVMNTVAKLRWVWLFFVDDPGGLCEAACKGYLTRRRRGGDGGGGGSLTGGTVLSAYRWA